MDSLGDARWAAVVERSASAAGLFVYAVATTRIFCRAGCPSRSPKRENVEFFSTSADAVANGYRACRRCRPDDTSTVAPQVASVIAVCRWLEHPGEDHGSTMLAKRVGWSKRHLQRVFREVVGVSMSDYLRAMREERVRGLLRSGETVTDAIYGAGYGSSRAFYEQGASRLGMTPTQYGVGAGGQSLSFGIAHSTVGSILVAATSKGICRVLVGDDSAALIEEICSEYPDATISPSDDTSEFARNIVAGVERGQSISSLPLDIQGTAFQQRVWDALRQIPAGSTRTYGEIAASIGAPTAARAVANACAANPTAVVIPCHRVVRGDGSLGGYRWGTQRKQRLLELEQPQHLPAKEHR